MARHIKSAMYLDKGSFSIEENYIKGVNAAHAQERLIFEADPGTYTNPIVARLPGRGSLISSAGLSNERESSLEDSALLSIRSSCLC